MSRYAHHNPDDPGMDRLLDRADHAKKEARENPDPPPPRLTREQALHAVRELLHGEEARAWIPRELRFAIDTAVCEYGHAAGMEALGDVQDVIRKVCAA